MHKVRWISVKVSERIWNVVKTAASTMGISISEFTRQAILEKLERMNVIASEVKAVLAQEVIKRNELYKRVPS